MLDVFGWLADIARCLDITAIAECFLCDVGASLILFRLSVLWINSKVYCGCVFFFFQAEDGIRDLVRSRGLGDVYKRQVGPYERRGCS